LMPDFGGAFRIPRVLPANVAREMLLTGENLDAVRAERLGFVNALTEPGQALSGSLALAGRVCANAPLAVRESLSVVNHEINGDEADTWARSDAAHARLLGSNDVKEGIGAFFERRPAHWTGT
jgi:enoyl-CoA hydratase